jgi:hypothetical protein
MLKRNAILIFFLFVFCFPAFAEQLSEQNFQLMFGYDVRPDHVEFKKPVFYQKELLIHDVFFKEEWKNTDDEYYISSISFELRVKKGNAILVKVPTQKFSLINAKQNAVIGKAELGDTLLTAELLDIQQTPTGITQITVSFTLSYPTPLEAKEEIESALALAKRASTFSKDKESLKIALYKQALSFIPESNNSLKAIKLRKDIQRKLSLLETK